MLVGLKHRVVHIFIGGSCTTQYNVRMRSRILLGPSKRLRSSRRRCATSWQCTAPLDAVCKCLKRLAEHKRMSYILEQSILCAPHPLVSFDERVNCLNHLYESKNRIHTDHRRSFFSAKRALSPLHRANGSGSATEPSTHGINKVELVAAADSDCKMIGCVANGYRADVCIRRLR